MSSSLPAVMEKTSSSAVCRSMSRGKRWSFFWAKAVKYGWKEAGNSLPNTFFFFFPSPSVKGETLFSSDLAWTWTACHVIDPGALHFPQTLLECAMHFQVLGDGVKFNQGSLCLAVLGACNPSGSKCLDLKKVTGFSKGVFKLHLSNHLHRRNL